MISSYLPAGPHFESTKVAGPTAVQRHLGKHNDVVAQLLEFDLRAVAANDADFLEPFRTELAWALTEANGRCQIDIRAASLTLKRDKNLDVERIQGI